MCSESGVAPERPARIASSGNFKSGFCGAGSLDFAAGGCLTVGIGASLIAVPR
jgi:hypothetical protein